MIKKNKNGLTLVEIIITLSIFFIVFTPLMMFITSGNRFFQQSQALTQSDLLAHSLMERMVATRDIDELMNFLVFYFYSYLNESSEIIHKGPGELMEYLDYYFPDGHPQRNHLISSFNTHRLNVSNILIDAINTHGLSFNIPRQISGSSISPYLFEISELIEDYTRLFNNSRSYSINFFGFVPFWHFNMQIVDIDAFFSPLEAFNLYFENWDGIPVRIGNFQARISLRWLRNEPPISSSDYFRALHSLVEATVTIYGGGGGQVNQLTSLIRLNDVSIGGHHD